MDCFLSAVRVSVFRKMPGYGASSDVEDAFWGLFKRAFSTSSSSSSYFAEDAHQSKQALKRKRAAAFFMGCYLCGMKASPRDEEGPESKAQFSFKEGHVQRKEGQCKEEGGLQWWQESGKKRRKLGSNKWIAGEGNGNFLNRAPAKLKRLLRRVRAKVRKLGQSQKAASFHYDPLSYSMNFDDGCWQHCDSHAKLSYASSSCKSYNNGKLLCKKGKGPSPSIVKAGAMPCLWQRRQYGYLQASPVQGQQVSNVLSRGSHIMRVIMEDLDSDARILVVFIEIKHAQSGCCKPPVACKFVYVDAKHWMTPSNPSVNGDCAMWDNDPSLLCYRCSSCKAGVIQATKDRWSKAGVTLFVVAILLVTLYAVLGSIASRHEK